MSNDRTPPWLITLRFILICSPVGMLTMIVFRPWAFYAFLGFFGTIFLYFQMSRFITNSVVWLYDPQVYKAMKRRGYDPFYNSLGSPLNNDDYETRAK